MRFPHVFLPAVLALAVCLSGCADTRPEATATAAASDSGAASRVLTRNLEEEMYFVEQIVRGTVLEVGKPFNRLFGKVTPSLIWVEEVIHGDPGKGVITLYQHGTPKTDTDGVLVSPGEEVILLLVETEEGFYWPYSQGVGVWKVKDGRVSSGPYRMYGTVEPHLFDELQNMKVDKFVKKIRKAARNKKRPEEMTAKADGEDGSAD